MITTNNSVRPTVSIHHVRKKVIKENEEKGRWKPECARKNNGKHSLERTKNISIAAQNDPTSHQTLRQMITICPYLPLLTKMCCHTKSLSSRKTDWSF
ncbi:hypothetical protein TNCT_11031 [Trichonephila clavata]|uniref:Uncharacterized protein n=1 Tax=Trichonephila clavata TaxID=2740835 RepID=A0A8X6H2D7_TRICU|nr:hypothetical protein TNCT_11031 [Trichonephila clavata]